MAFMKSAVDAIQRVMVPTGQKVGAKKKKRGLGGMMAKVVETAAQGGGGGGRDRANVEEDGLRGGILSAVKRAIKRKAY